MRILFVTARLPYPPLKGDQVRGYHHLRLLSKSHRVTLASLVDDPTTPKDRDALSPFVDRTITVPLKKNTNGLQPYTRLVIFNPSTNDAISDPRNEECDTKRVVEREIRFGLSSASTYGSLPVCR